MYARSERDLAIERACRAAADQVERSVDGGWRLVLAEDGQTVLRARVIDDDWLVAGVLHAWSGLSLWPVLQLNAGLPGCVRLTGVRGSSLEVRGEILLESDATVILAEDELSLDERVARLCGDVVRAGRNCIGGGDDSGNRSCPVPSDSEALLRMCRDTGWEARLLESGHVLAALDTGAMVCQATLSLGVDGYLRALTPLTTSAALSHQSRDAIALVLLTASAQLRMVKGIARREAEGETVGLAFAGERRAATGAIVDCALGALSVACRAVGLEVQALQSTNLAREYLAIRGLSPVDFVSPTASFEQEDMPCLQLP